MSGVKRRLIGLGLPPILFFAVDMGMTLSGQPAEYWAGNYSKFNEVSPALASWLSISPLVFVAGCAGIAVVTIALVLLLPEILALVGSIAGVMGGTYGASTWLIYSGRFRHGYQLSNLLLLAAAATIGVSIRYVWRARPEEEYRLSIRPVWRWMLAALLVPIAVWLMLRA